MLGSILGPPIYGDFQVRVYNSNSNSDVNHNGNNNDSICNNTGPLRPLDT